MPLANITLLEPFNIDSTSSYVFGNVNVGNLKTDHLLYANGSQYVFTTNAAGSNTQVQFNDSNSFAGSANLTFNKSSNTLTVTNIVANGIGLTSLTGANVTGFVPNANIANIAYSVSAANITGTIDLANYATTANSVAVANISGIGNIATINKDGNASNILYGNGVFAAAPSGGGGASVTVGSTPPVSPTSGSLWYDNTTTGELYVYSGNTWVTTSIMPITNVNDPVVSGPTQANEISTQTFTITNYNISFAYVIAVTGGSFTRSGNTISWTMPAVTSNTSHYMTTQVVSGGVTSSIDTRTVLVVNLNIDDTAVVVTDFSYNRYNSGWTI